MINIAAIAIERDVDRKALAMPSKERASCDDGLIENHDYVDIRGIDLDDALAAIKEEADLLKRIADTPADRQEDDLNELEDELIEEMSPLGAFEIGVAGLVYGLSALGCVPISSCNGGAFGGPHALPHPWIIFYAPLSVVDQLLQAAEATDTGLINNYSGMLEAFADDIRKFNRMAHLLVTQVSQ